MTPAPVVPAMTFDELVLALIAAARRRTKN
jgi:hypothetical protein